MIRYARDFRLIPVVLLATICLFALKVSGLGFDGGSTLAARPPGLPEPAMQITSAESVPDYLEPDRSGGTLPRTALHAESENQTPGHRDQEEKPGVADIGSSGHQVIGSSEARKVSKVLDRPMT